jgi:molybdopterin/thiamine biosynthesis adenylyltransferase
MGTQSHEECVRASEGIVTKVFVFDRVLPELDRAKGNLYGLEVRRAGERRVVVASTKPKRGLTVVASVVPTRELPLVCREGDSWVVRGQAGDRVPVEVVRWSTDYAARQAGIVDTSALGRMHLGVIGVSSVGLPISTYAVRSGVGTMTVVDPDTVALENLCRMGFTTDQINMPKVQAAAEILSAINPLADIRPVAKPLQSLLDDPNDPLGSADLIVAAASNAVGFALAAEYHHRIPIIFPAMYRRGIAGEIFVSGGKSHADRACFACFRGRVGGRATESGRTWNYDAPGQELAAQPALGADIGIVTAIASSIAVNILAGDADRVIDLSRPLLLVSNRTDSVLPASYETRWILVDRDPICPNHAPRQEPTATELEEVLASIPEAP